ncbi:MAG: tetraacyldisaccharide 4'-kinase [Chlamydiota bacterium]
MQLETYITDVIEGRRKVRWIRGILHALSHLMKAGVKLRHFAFNYAILKKQKVAVPVVSIGNIVAGGTGKTALVEKLGKELSCKGKLAVLSRGYRSKLGRRKQELHLLNPSHVSPELCGDEPYLLFKALPGAAIFVGKNRVASAKRAAYQSVDLIFLDDGMQYRRLHRDLEIVMLQASDLYGKGFFLPRGYLRDFPERLACADYLFAHGVFDANHYDVVRKTLARYSAAPVIGTKMKAQRVMTSLGEEWLGLEEKRVGVFCGLGHPTSFFQTVRSFGGDIVEQWKLPDHVAPKEKELRRFAQLCERKHCDLLLCSEKDWVKLPSNLSSLPLPIGWLKASIEIVAGAKLYKQLLRKLEIYLEHKENCEALD